MSILIFWPGVLQIPSIPSSRRRYVDDPLYAIAIGNRLPMNIVTGDSDNLTKTGIKDGDFLLSRNSTEFKLAAFDETNDLWQLFDTTTTLDSRYLKLDTSNDPLTGTLQINGGLITGGSRVKSTETSTGTATIASTAEIHICNSASPYTLTMPTGVAGKVIHVINKGAGAVTISGSINSTTALTTLLSGESQVYIYDGTDSEWI